MKIFNNENGFEKRITILYFTIALVEAVAEFFEYKPVLFVVKPLGVLVFMGLYWCSSVQKKALFFVVFSFVLTAKICVIYDGEKMLFFSMIAFLLHRIVMIHYIAKLIKLKDYIPLFIVMMPFLFFFLYLLSLASNISERSYYTLLFQSIMTAILVSMTVSHYFMNNDKAGFWLLIFGLISVMHFFIVFVDRFYLENLSPAILSPLRIILTNSACYTFYKFVITTERSNDN